MMDDYISRQGLMKEFSDFVRRSNNSDFAKTPTWNDAVSLVGSMPDAPVREVKRGRWTTKEGDVAFYDVCSACGEKVLHKYPYWNFCPNCGSYNGENGADMREDGE